MSSDQHDDESPRVLGSNAERDRAVEKLGKELKRHEPVERFDFRALVPPGVHRLPTQADADVIAAKALRAKRLQDAGIVDALMAQDYEWLVEDGEPPEPSGALRRVWRWQARRREGATDFTSLVLVGLKGRGKTVAGAWLLAHYGPGVYCTAEQLRASFEAPYYAADRELIRRAYLTRVLFVDELGREKDAESAKACLFDVINSRRGAVYDGMTLRPLEFQRWTLLAGNISEKDFKARYDESMVAKLEQQGAINTAKGPDLRVRLIDRLKSQGQAVSSVPPPPERHGEEP